MRNIFTLLFLCIFVTSRAQDGRIDPGFGTGGKQVTGLSGPVFPDLQQIAVLPGGKILQVSSVSNGSNYDFALTRFDKDGNLDPTFDGDGVVLTDFATGDDIATSIAVRPDGKIIVAGYTSVGGGSRQIAVARYNADGTLDNTFDSDGKITTAVGTDDVAMGVAQIAGKTYVVGSSFTGSHYDFSVVAYNDNGTLDASFGGGKVTTSIGGQQDQAYDVGFTPDGKLVVAGYSTSGSNFLFAIAKYNANGTLDNTFDGDSGTGNGVVTKAINTGIGGNDWLMTWWCSLMEKSSSEEHQIFPVTMISQWYVLIRMER